MAKLKSEKTFWVNVAQVLSGAAVAQAIPILGSLVIARLFIPEEFGIFSVWLGAVLFFAVICTGRYEMSLPLEEDGEPRKKGVVATLYVVLIASIFGGAIVAILTSFKLINNLSDGLVIMAIPAGALLGITAIWQTWASAAGRFHELSKMKVMQALSITLIQVGIGFVYPTIATLIIGQLVGTLAGVLYSLYLLPLQRQYLINCNYHHIKAYLERHKRFLAFSLPADAINTASAQLPLIIIGTSYGAEVTGFLAMTMRALGAPIALLGRSVLDVFRRHASVSYRKHGGCRSEYVQTFKTLSLASILVMTIFYMFSEDIFVIAFGDKWRISGVIAIWMLPMFALRFVSSPLSYMLYLANKQHVDLIWQICLLIMTIGTLYFSTGYKQALIAYSIGYSMLYIVYLLISYHLSYAGEKHI